MSSSLFVSASVASGAASMTIIYVVLHVLVSLHLAAGVARAGGAPSPTADLVAAAARAFFQARSAFAHALAADHARMVLLGAWRRRAGCDAAAVLAPVARWEALWMPICYPLAVGRPSAVHPS